MPAPYNYQLRKKVIDAVEAGEKKTLVCRIFNISRNTLNLWLKRKQETGDFRPIIKNSGGKKNKILNLNKFKDFVLSNNHKTQIQLAELWGNNLTQQNVSRACQKLGITRKKKPMVIKKEMKKRENNFKIN